MEELDDEPEDKLDPDRPFEGFDRGKRALDKATDYGAED